MFDFYSLLYYGKGLEVAWARYETTQFPPTPPMKKSQTRFNTDLGSISNRDSAFVLQYLPVIDDTALPVFHAYLCSVIITINLSTYTRD